MAKKKLIPSGVDSGRIPGNRGGGFHVALFPALNKSSEFKRLTNGGRRLLIAVSDTSSGVQGMYDLRPDSASGADTQENWRCPNEASELILLHGACAVPDRISGDPSRCRPFDIAFKRSIAAARNNPTCSLAEHFEQ